MSSNKNPFIPLHVLAGKPTNIISFDMMAQYRVFVADKRTELNYYICQFMWCDADKVLLYFLEKPSYKPAQLRAHPICDPFILIDRQKMEYMNEKPSMHICVRQNYSSTFSQFYIRQVGKV